MKKKKEVLKQQKDMTISNLKKHELELKKKELRLKERELLENKYVYSFKKFVFKNEFDT